MNRPELFAESQGETVAECDGGFSVNLPPTPVQ